MNNFSLATTVIAVGMFAAMLPRAATANPEIYKQKIDAIERQVLNNRCQQKTKKYQDLEYTACTVQGKPITIVMEGPPGDPGPACYFERQETIAFRETAATSYSFFRNRKLQAEIISIGGQPERIKTKFTPKEREELSNRALSLCKEMRQIFGYSNRPGN